MLKVKERLSATLEQYLEALARDEAETGVARLGTVAKSLGVRPSSAFVALDALCTQGFCMRVGRGLFRLTETGINYNEGLINRQNILKKFFHEVLEMNPGEAEEQACEIEHLLRDELIDRMERFLKSYQLIETRTGAR